MKVTTGSPTEPIFRQAAHSSIIVNAHRVNQGLMPLPNSNSDFFMLYVDTPDDIYETLIDLVTRRLPSYYKCDPVNDIQVLTPMNRGSLGSISLNIALQAALNSKSKPNVTRFGSTYAPGDKVIQM